MDDPRDEATEHPLDALDGADLADLDEEQWEAVEAAMAALDEATGDDDPRPFDAWRRRTATGALLTGIALGLQQVFDPPQDDGVEVVQLAPSGPDDDPIQLALDPDDPAASEVRIRYDGDPPAST